VLILVLGLWSDAFAQSCVCSRDVALPTGVAIRPGAVTVGVEYNVRQTGGKTAWEGIVPAKDRNGDSMAGMAMPGHLTQVGTLDATFGLPRGFSLRVAAPYASIGHLFPSEMPGDYDTRGFGDVIVAQRWAWRSDDELTFVGVSLGATLPTGKTTEDTIMRTGKGSLGGTSSVTAMRRVSPLVALAGSLAYNPSFFTPSDGYRVGSNGNAAAGTRFTFRENGRLMLQAFGVLIHQRPDLWNDFRYKETGVTALDVSVGSSFTFWEKKLRSAALLTRVEVPVAQVVGDPPFAENWSVAVGVNATVF
jgi:hypothetical protein